MVAFIVLELHSQSMGVFVRLKGFRPLRIEGTQKVQEGDACTEWRPKGPCASSSAESAWREPRLAQIGKAEETSFPAFDLPWHIWILADT